MSAVIGVVLLLAIAVLLAAVVAPLMFGVISDFRSDSPDAEFAFLYEDGEPLDSEGTVDDFGTPVERGEGLVSVQLQRGGTLDPENIEIRSSVSGGSLLDNTSSSVYAPDDRVEDGDIVTVTAVRGETIQVIWTGDGGQESAILDGFTVEAPADLVSNPVPEPNRNCEYIEEQLTDDDENDIEVVGVVVECDLDQFYPRIDDITIESENGNPGAVIGDINGTGDIDTDAGNIYEGNVESGTDGDDGDVDVKNGSNYYGDIITKGDSGVDIDGQSSVEGRVKANGSVSLQTNSSVGGEIRSGTDGSDGDIDITASRVGNSVFAGGDGSVDIDEQSFVDGVVESVNTVDVQENSEVAGRILAGNGTDDGTVTVTASEVGGSITSKSEGGVDISTDSTVGGEIESVGIVDVQGGSRVLGEIVAGTNSDDGTVTVTDSQVDGPITSESEGGVDIDEGSTVDGAVDSVGSVDVQEGTRVLGGVTAKGDTTVNGGSTVDGDIDSNGNVDVNEGSTVDGGIEVTGGSNVDLSNADVNGHVSLGPSGTFSCSNSTILDMSCSEYRSPQYELNITGTNSPTTTNNGLVVNLLVENVGFNGKSDISLLVDGDEKKTRTAEIDRSNDDPTQVEFSWETDSASTGEHNVTVTSAVDSDSTTVYISSPDGPAFEVSSISGNDEVLAGNTLDIDTTVKNTGDTKQDATVELQDFDGSTVDSKTVTIADGESETVSLSWVTDSGDVGTGDVTVDVGTDSDTKAVEVRESYYNLTDVVLYWSGNGNSPQDLDVEVFVNATSDATMEIRLDDGDETLNSRTESAISNVYTILQDEQPKDVSGEVVVTLYDGNDNQQDSMTRDWDGGGKGNNGNDNGNNGNR